VLGRARPPRCTRGSRAGLISAVRFVRLLAWLVEQDLAAALARIRAALA
jgi:hypothetical protein